MALQFEADVFYLTPGADPTRVTRGDGIYYQPCIDPAGGRVLCAGATAADAHFAVWEFALDGGAGRKLSPDGVGVRHPVVSLDSGLVACAAESGSNQSPADTKPDGAPAPGAPVDIAVLDADGSLHRLTTGPSQDQRPTISPDGETIAFVSDRDGRLGIWTVPLGGGTPERLVDAPAYRPWFSPDGSFLVCFVFVERGKRHQLHRIPVDGGDLEPIAADDRGLTHGPWVTFDSSRILAHSTRDGAWGLHEFPVDGGEPRRVPVAGAFTPTHATMARDGSLTFDQVRRSG